MTGDTTGFLIVGAVLFCLGVVGFLTRRNLILMLISAELMLHAVAINLTSFSRHYGHHDGQVFTIFLLTIAACEAGIGLSLVLVLYQRTKSLDVRLWSNLGEVPLAPEAAPVPGKRDSHEALPVLTPAGIAPLASSLASGPLAAVQGVGGAASGRSHQASRT